MGGSFASVEDMGVLARGACVAVKGQGVAAKELKGKETHVAVEEGERTYLQGKGGRYKREEERAVPGQHGQEEDKGGGARGKATTDKQSRRCRCWTGLTGGAGKRTKQTNRTTGELTKRLFKKAGFFSSVKSPRGEGKNCK